MDKDLAEAERWFRKSVAQDFRAAEANLCKLFTRKVDGLDGTNPPLPDTIAPLKGTSQDVNEAFNWCGKAAERGNVEGEQRLGALYAKGSSEISPDFEKACFWLSVPMRTPPFRAKVAPNLTLEKRADIEKQAHEWKPGTRPPFAPPAPPGP